MKRNQAVKVAADKTRGAAQRAGMTAQQAAERAGLAAHQATERAGLAAQHAGPMLDRAKDQAGTLLEKGRDNAGPLLAKARDEAIELYGKAVEEIAPVVTEGRRRAKLAAQAARGEKPPRRWPWVAGAIAFGSAVGAAVTSLLRRQRQVSEDLAPVPAPAEPVTPAQPGPKRTGMVPDAEELPNTGIRSDNSTAHARREN